MKKLLIGAGIVLVAGAGVAANLWWRRPTAPEVEVETVSRRDLTALVSGSGRVRPFREVDISANVMGRITRLEVEEGREVRRGELLLEIDPIPYRSAVEQVQAALAAARTQLGLAEENLAFARQTLDRREGLYRQGLLSREAYEQALQEVQAQERSVELRGQEVARLEAQLVQARHDLTKVRIDAPMDGVITRLNVEEGENVVTGTMNNPGTVIMTIADLSVIEAEIEVDETDVVSVQPGQRATVRIDAFPDQEYEAVVTEVGKSPLRQAALTQAAGDEAVNFKVVVRLTSPVPGARPGLSCTADIVTATRRQAVAVPIQALTLREVAADTGGDGAGGDGAPQEEGGGGQKAGEPAAQRRREREGAFVYREGQAVFVPLRVGIAGERHFEVLEGVEVGDQVIVGPFDVLRNLQDGDPVRLREPQEEVQG